MPCDRGSERVARNRTKGKKNDWTTKIGEFQVGFSFGPNYGRTGSTSESRIGAHPKLGINHTPALLFSLECEKKSSRDVATWVLGGDPTWSETVASGNGALSRSRSYGLATTRPLCTIALPLSVELDSGVLCLLCVPHPLSRLRRPELPTLRGFQNGSVSSVDGVIRVRYRTGASGSGIHLLRGRAFCHWRRRFNRFYGVADAESARIGVGGKWVRSLLVGAGL